MRIDHLDLIAYGCFTKSVIDLSGGSYGLHLIYGDNEAGKSTSLRALSAWLFGIPKGTSDNFSHSHSQLKIGGRLRLDDGSVLAFTRKKGNKNTLLKYGTNEPLDEDSLVSFLPHGIDQDIFLRLWGINHARLIAGGRELFEQSGDIGQALFSVATGARDLRTLLTTLQSSADAIFKPNGTKPVINQKITAYKEAKKKIKDNTLDVSEWKALQEELTNTTHTIEEVEKNIENKEREKYRLERAQRVHGVFAERAHILERIDVFGALPSLPEDFEEKRKSARDALDHASKTHKHLESDLFHLTETLHSLNIRDDLLENEEMILSLYRELGALEKVIHTLPQKYGQLKLLKNQAEAMLKDMRPDITLSQAKAILYPVLNNKKRVTTLAQEYSLLVQRQQQVQESLNNLNSENKSLINQSSQLEASAQFTVDLRELRSVIGDGHKLRNIEADIAEEHKKAINAIKECESELTRLGRYNGTIDSLLSLKTILLETLDNFEKTENPIQEQRQNIERKKEEHTQSKISAQRDLLCLSQRGINSTPNDLAKARNIRDHHWQLIKRTYIEHPHDSTHPEDGSIVPHYGKSDHLVEAYETSIKAVDHIADYLKENADDVFHRVALEERIKNCQSLIGDLSIQYAKVETDHKQFQRAWRDFWRPLNIEPGTPREMKQWLPRAEKLIEKIRSAKQHEVNERDLKERYTQIKQTVSSQISLFNPKISTQYQGMGLETLISLCEKHLEEEEKKREQYRHIKHKRDQLKISLERETLASRELDDQMSQWSKEWHHSSKGLGVHVHHHPEYIVEVFDKLSSLFDKIDQIESLQTDIQAMTNTQEEFTQKIGVFSEKIGCEREDTDAPILIAQLNNDLNMARVNRTKATNLKEQIQKINQQLQNASITIDTSTQELLLLQKSADSTTEEDAIVVWKKYKEKRKLEKELHTLELELTRHGDGLSIEELAHEIHNLDIETINADLRTLSYELKHFQSDRDTLRDKKQTITNTIEAKDGSALAAQASQEAQENLASIGINAEEYLRLQAAALILEQRIEHYRKNNQESVLARAGALFSQLTLNSYDGLKDELDDFGKPILLGVRPNEQEVSIEGMSDGSRDQLYLALRLATLEKHLTQREPIPFIVDDILVGFDDQRTRVCLEILADLSSRVQVLLFTHHKRVLELAEGINAKAGIFCHRLS